MEECGRSDEETDSSKECVLHQRSALTPQGDPGPAAPDPRHSFVLFLENCAPVVNTLNFGISSPILLSHPHLQLAHIKTQLALRNLTSTVTSNSTAPIHALLTQALLKISTANAMFNARGGFSGQRPMGAPRMNQPPMNHGMNMSGMNMPSMNIGNLGIGMNISSLSQPTMNPGMSRVGPSLGMNPSLGLGNLNPPAMNVNRMGLPGMNQGGMGFQSESPGFNMRTMDSPGSFLGGPSDSLGMKSMPLRPPMHSAPPPSVSSHFPAPPVQMTPSQPRLGSQGQKIPSIVNRSLTHSSDHMLGKASTPLQEPAQLGTFGNVNQDVRMNPAPVSSSSPSSVEPATNAQKRYTNESASSILESFGLSNEDLEELSRYPDDKLTPMNLPNILREIRMRKVSRTAGASEQSTGGVGSVRRPGGEVVASKVIDYGHSSKYKINDSPSSRSFESSRSEQKPAVREDPKSSTSSINKPKTSSSHTMENKIPTISSSRTQNAWPTPKANRPNNKTLVGEQNACDDSKVSASPVMAVQQESASLDVPTSQDSSVGVTDNASAVTAAHQESYQSSNDQANLSGKASWGPSQDDAQKTSKIPTPSMMKDYFASSPRIFPHICSLCNVECRSLKDWIKHQNNSSHIENCRNLRQQYPDWNPQVQTPSSTDVKNEAPKKHSRSKSGSPRRSRRSGSRHRTRRSRSRSPKPTGRRSRSRSPRRPRHSPSGRARSPHRNAPPRPQSPRRYRRARSNSPPDKKAVDAAVQNFIESSKQKSGDRGRPEKPVGDGKKFPPKTPTNVKGKRPASPTKSTTSSNGGVKKLGSSPSHSTSSSKKPTGNSSAKKPSSSGGTSSSSSRRPTSGSASRKSPPRFSASKKPVVSTGAKKTTASTSFKKKPPPPPSKPPAPEPSSPLNKFSSKESTKKIIHVTNLPDHGYTDQDILKVVQQFGKVCDILIVRSRNEAFLETNFKEAAAAAVKYSETVPVIINSKRVTLSLAGENKETKPETKSSSDSESKPQKPVESKSTKKADEPTKKPEETTEKEPPVSKHDIEVPPGFVKCYKLAEPNYKDHEKHVVVISNLPEKPSSVEEIANLAKPFGGVKDLLVISTHKKAYLELHNRKSVDSMLKFYDAFPVNLGGNLLKIVSAPKYKDVKDVNRIFAEIIEDANFKITPSIYEQFVCLNNLPDKGYEDFDVYKIGLRFGRVEHYIVIINKRRAILHMSTNAFAKAMHSFLSKYPATIGGSKVQCTLPFFNTKLAEDEYTVYLEEEPKSSDQGVAALIPEGEETALPEAHTEGSEMDVDAAGDQATSLSGMSQDEDEEDEEEEDDEEEAAEAPEAPESSTFVFTQPEPITAKEQTAAPEVFVSEECDVLVSVESDEEEECETPAPALQSMTPVSSGTEQTAEESEEHESDVEECPNDIPCDLELEASGDPQNLETEGNDESKPKVPDATKEGADGNSAKRSEDSKSESSNTSRKSGKPVEEKPKDAKGKSPSAVVRTAKYNAQKGDISVTVTVENQKSSRTQDSRKRSSGDRGSSGRDGSTPKSSSSRSSPPDNTSGNSKNGYQAKGNNRGSTSRTSNRKDDRSKSSSSSSSRYNRSSKGSSSSRTTRAEEEEDTFPFNLDEFVTVDEIVEEPGKDDEEDENNEEEEAASEAASAPIGGKRKETDPPATPDAKKAKAEQDLSFVTLDEVGDEDEKAEKAQPLPAAGAKAQASKTPATFDEVSDDEEVPTSEKEPPAPAEPKITSKDKLVTVDEINADEEETTGLSKTEKLPQQEGEKAEEKVLPVSEQKESPEVNNSSLKAPALNKEEEEDEEESMEDIEQKFLTVDEVGEDEEDSEMKDEGDASQTSTKSSQPDKTPAKMVRPQKRPLPDNTADGKGSLHSPVKANVKSPRPSTKTEESPTPKKPEAGASTPKTETPAKKTKLDSPASGKAKLGPFNSTVAVGMEYLVPKTGFFCELCSLFYMDEASKLKHCKSLRHYQAVQKQLAKEDGAAEIKSPNT